jgi:hypothetical protein
MHTGIVQLHENSRGFTVTSSRNDPITIEFRNYYSDHEIAVRNTIHPDTEIFGPGEKSGAGS